jgi:hypothetical protein
VQRVQQFRSLASAAKRFHKGFLYTLCCCCVASVQEADATAGAAPSSLSQDERLAQHAAAVAAATAVLSEASASALKDVIAEEGISQEERAESIAAAREQRMQQLLYAITVLASTSGVCIALRSSCWEPVYGNKCVWTLPRHADMQDNAVLAFLFVKQPYEDTAVAG